MFGRTLRNPDLIANDEFKSYIKDLKFQPETCVDILELNRVIDSVVKEIKVFEEKYYSIPPSAYKFLAKCSLTHKMLLKSI